MNLSKAELRTALQHKLQDRRRLMTENTALRRSLGTERRRTEALLGVLANPLSNMALEECADKIVAAVLERAVEVSSIVAHQAMDTGDYEFGISIPSFHIRHRIERYQFDLAADTDAYESVVNRRVINL